MDWIAHKPQLTAQLPKPQLSCCSSTTYDFIPGILYIPGWYILVYVSHTSMYVRMNIPGTYHDTTHGIKTHTIYAYILPRYVVSIAQAPFERGLHWSTKAITPVTYCKQLRFHSTSTLTVANRVVRTCLKPSHLLPAAAPHVRGTTAYY